MDGSPTLHGTVLGIAKGITDQDNRDGPQLLSSINPTFTWVRLAQRIPSAFGSIGFRQTCLSVQE